MRDTMLESMRISKQIGATLTLIASLFICACSGGDDTTYEIDDLCGENDGAFHTFVDKVFECAPEIEFFFGAAPSAAEIGEACSAQFEGVTDDGTAEFQDRSNLNACLAAIEAADCLTFDFDNLPECDDLVAGTLDVGSACELDDQCSGDAYCRDGEDGNCGSCTATLADGVSCDSNSECTSGKCRSNGACGPFGVEGSTCDDNDDCVGQLICDETCQTPTEASVGDDCFEFAQCGFPFSGLFCNEEATQCEEFLNVGDDCFDGTAALGVCDLVSYETCDFEGTSKCIAPTTVGLGDACAFQAGNQCDDGLICGDGICREPGEGSACDSGSDSNTCGLFLECKSDDTCGYENEYSGICPEV